MVSFSFGLLGAMGFWKGSPNGYLPSYRHQIWHVGVVSLIFLWDKVSAA